MKMEMPVEAGFAATVDSVLCSEGDSVNEGIRWSSGAIPSETSGSTFLAWHRSVAAGRERPLNEWPSHPAPVDRAQSLERLSARRLA